MSQFCADINCAFYITFPDGTNIFTAEVCPLCSKSPLIGEKPLPPDEQIAEPPTSSLSSIESDRELLMVNNCAIDAPISLAHKHCSLQTDNVIVTFYTAILLRHFKSARPNMSVRFENSHLMESLVGSLDVNVFQQKDYENNTYALLRNSINIPLKILRNSGVKGDETLVIPYRYLLNGLEEKLCSEKGATHRALLLHSSNFYSPNFIDKYDMLILPPDLANEDQHFYHDVKLSWKIIFNLYSPNLSLSKEGKLLPFNRIKEDSEAILHSLCYSFVCKQPSIFAKMEHYNYHDMKEDVSFIMYKLLLNWIETAIQTDLPFHIKFYLSFLSLDNDMMQANAGEIYYMVFQNLSCGFVLSIIQEESKKCLFLKHQIELLAYPQLLHSAMRRVSELDTDSLVLFLPLYHILFNSEQEFEQAHVNHSFMDNAYWGLPAGIQFKHNHNIELTKIINVISQLNTISPILIYSVTLLYFRLDLFSQLMRLIGIPFLPFFSVLLYRIEKWSLLREDTELRESVFKTFLTQSVQTPNMMSQKHVFQASDVILQIILLIMGNQDIPKLSFKEACLFLKVLARLFTIYVEDNETRYNIYDLISSSALLESIKESVDEDKLNKLPQCSNECIYEVTVWNTLYCIEFPPSYGWAGSVRERFSKRIKYHSLHCLLKLIVHLCLSLTEGELERETAFHEINKELIQIAEESQTPMADYEIIIHSLIEVPENRFYYVIDLLAKIIVLLKLEINDANPVEHILSVSWYPALFKRCNPNLLKNSKFPEAQTLLSFCVNTVRKLHTEFQTLNISVDYLYLVIKYKSTYLLLLKSLPAAAITNVEWHDATFNSNIECRESILNYFMRQHKLIGDLKRLLESTNSGIYSTEISDFLNIKYNFKSISFLCSSSDENEFVLLPSDNHFASLNKPKVRTMLNSLSDLVQSQFFKSQFKHNVSSHLKSTNSNLTIDVDIIYEDLWAPALRFVSIALSSLFDMTILLSSIEEYFGIYSDCPEQINDEISHLLLPALDIFSEDYNEAKLKKSLDKFICYFHLKLIEKFVSYILQVKNAYRFTGQFSVVESISNLQLNAEGNQLSIITPELLSTTSTLSDLTDLHLEILQTLLECVELFTWTASVLTKSADLDNFIDLALNSVDSLSFQVNRITSFKDVCTIFMPFILKLRSIDQHSFFERLELVHDNLQKTDNFHQLLKMSKDCAKESELEFWKELKQTYTSIGGKTISQLKRIMLSGKFILSTKPNTRSINDILKLHVCSNTSTFSFQKYSLEELRGMQSNIILITPTMQEDKNSAKFIAILEKVIILADLFMQMHINGNVFFRELTHEYACQSIDSVKQDITFLRNECKWWTAQLVEARNNNYLLNFFTASQIVAIQVGLEDMDNGKDLNRDTFHLLSLVREQLSQQDIEKAYNGVKRASSSHVLNNFPESSVDCIATLTNRRESLSQSDNTFGSSLPSIPTDDDAVTKVTSIQDLYQHSNKTLYSLNDVAIFLHYLYSDNIPEETLLKSFLKDNELNVIIVEKSNLLIYVLSLYFLTYARNDFPSNHEVLICSEDTTMEEIDIFWRRALNSISSSEIFCLTFIENLKYEVAAQGVASLKEHLQLREKGRKFRLVLLCSIESEQSSYMATALAQYRRMHTQLTVTEKLKDCIFQRISQIRTSTNGAPNFPNKPSSVIDPDKSCVRIICSEFASAGKSLTVLRLEERLKEIANIPHSENMCTTVNVYDSEDCEHKAATRLIESPAYSNLYGRICHIDITATSYEELIPFLFKLLITGVISDKDGRIWRCSKRDYYVIEITLSSQTPELLNFLALFPDWQCFTPILTLEYLKIHKEPPIHTKLGTFDKKEMESPEYQRVYAYLHILEYKQKSQNMDAFSYKNTDPPQCKNPIELLSVLLKYCSIGKPSWSVLKHFISFLNSQLVACEGNIYCNIMVTIDKSWKGFKTFLVDCMILMSRDFTTPSLRNCLEGQPTDIIQGYGIEARRKWEEKNHPYIFLNEDRQTMSFFGIYITDQLEQLDSFDAKRVIGKKVIPKELYRALKLNKADMEQECSSWDRNKMISILSNVMNSSSVPWTDIDPFYVMTIDNLKKMLAIHMRFRCNIPVIIMGETGCGKTRLINFMCKLQAMKKNIENLVVLKVHGETTREDILKSYKGALALARKNIDKEVDTILFFDEANTSHTIGLIKEILCDRRIDGNQIPTDIRFQFIAACNPYREHTPEMKEKLASAGLGMITGDKLAREHFGDIPLRNLVYRVIPLPQSLLPLVWDFGKLSSETENAYITEIIKFYFTGKHFEQLHTFCKAVAKVLSAAQEYMRERRDECSFVSLRDVERTVRVMLWFYKLIPRLHIKPTDSSLETYSLILSLSVCYRAKLKDRIAFDSCFIANLEAPLISITEVSMIDIEIDRCQTRIVDLMKIPDHIARNAALKENLFMIYVCIQLKIPLFIIGKPGSSKSLARSIISHSINEGIIVGGNKIAKYTRVYMQCYQCSQYTTSKEISNLFVKCQTIQKEVTADSVACVVLDEVGLAEDSPNLPLKVLHSLLEDSASSGLEQKGSSVAFIGLSNWALDPAKMNRGIMVQLKDPSIEELVKTAHAIIKPSGQVDDFISERLNLYVRNLAEGYLELSMGQNDLISKDYFGLRDFYCLMKMLYSLCRQYSTPLNKLILIHAVKRNFGGIGDVNVLDIFKKTLSGLSDSETGPLSDPLSLIRASLSPPLNAASVGEDSSLHRSRYLLLLTDNIFTFELLFQSKILEEDTKVMFGSSFPLDKESFNICHNISRIKIHMELGHVVVLTNLSNLYASLYELLNQFYVRLLGKNWVTIGIGAQRVECPVHPKFRLIVIADKTTVDQFPPPLINRLEKQTLTASTLLIGDIVVKDIVSKLCIWIESFISVYESTRKYKHIMCFIGFQKDTPSFVVYSTISKLGYKGRENQNGEKILEECKLELLKLASPDSILRLPRSRLSSEADSISSLYFNLKLFSLSHYLKQLFEDQTRRGESPILSFVTTRSQLLTETDGAELVRILESSCKFHFNILNLYLSQFKTEIEFVSCIRDEISSQHTDTDGRTVLLIQSTNGNTNCDLISCAKYKVMEIVSESKLNSNFYFIFIVKLLVTTQNSSIAGFCGFPWDSVHIDELRHPYHNLLPSLDVIQHTSVADIFDINYPAPEEYFLYSNEDNNNLKRRRLLGCVHAAVSRLIDPRQCSSEWKGNKISRFTYLLSEDRFSDLADILCGKISQLLRQITLREYSSAWSLLSSLRANNLINYSTVMKTLSHYIDTAIEPILSGVLGVIDSHNDLNIAFSNGTEVRELLKILFQDESLFDFNYLLSPESLRNPKLYTTEFLKTPVFNTSFPFFLTVYQQVTRLFQELNMQTGNYQSWKRLNAVFGESFVGQAVKSIKFENPFYIHYKYLESFVMLHISQFQDHTTYTKLYKVVYVMLVVTISNCHRKLKGEEGTTVNPEGLPEVTIPLIHIANDFIRERIAFVKEAYSLGFSLPKPHLINLHDALKNPKTYSELKNIDFDLFASIIDSCSKKVSNMYTEPDTSILVQYFQTCEPLIDENFVLFHNNFRDQLDSLRCSWYASQTVVLFATNVIEIFNFRDLLRSQDLLKSALSTLHKIVCDENVNFQSPETVKSILEMLKSMNSRAGKCTSDDEQSHKLWILFQVHITRFFHQFLATIVFRAAVKKLPDGLIKEIIDLALLNKEEISDTRGINLFRLSVLNPSPELRCILLELVFRESERNELNNLIRNLLKQQMEDVYTKINLNQSTQRNEIAIIVLQSFENSYHLRLAEYLTFDDKLSYIRLLIADESLYLPLSDSSVSHKLVESVAVLRFAITWLVKWYSALDFKTSYLRSQATSSPAKNSTINRGLYHCFDLLYTMIDQHSLHNSLLLFLLKTLSFNTGFGNVLSHPRYDKCRLTQGRQHNRKHVDLFHAVDPNYSDTLNSLSNNNMKPLKKQIEKKKSYMQSIIFATFSVSCAHYLSVDVSQDTKSLFQERYLNDPLGFTCIQKLKWIQLLPPDLKSLVDALSQNKFLNMSQFNISKETHLNTVLIAGLLCHIAVLLHYAQDNVFLKPLTLIHYDPSALKDKYLPAVPYELQSAPKEHCATTRYCQSIQPTRFRGPKESVKTSSMPNVNTISYNIIHSLGNPLERTSAPTGIRRLSGLSAALLRSIMHCIFTYTLQTKHMQYPTKVTQLVEPTGIHTCSEYFFLHLIQDITDVTTITNKTFEEAILIIHTLIDQLIEYTAIRAPTCLDTKEDLEKWENAFDNFHMSRLDILNDQVLREKMIIVLSQNSDITLRGFYEEGETGFRSRLWRHRNIVGYDNLLQVFSCQFSSTHYPLLEKFLNEQPLLAVTKYIPEFVSLQVKFVQKSLTYFKNKKVRNLSDFLDIIQKEASNEHVEYINQVTSLTQACIQLVKERHKLNIYYPEMCSIYEITVTNTLVSQLVTTSHQSVGVLTSLIQLLVKIHNSFVDIYRQTFPNKQSRSRSTIPLSLVTSHHLINYKPHLQNIIMSNASHSFLIGEGTLITYDFNGIEKDFANCIMRNKLWIEDDLKVDHSEGTLLNILKRLQLNIPQERVTEDNWNSIKAELMGCKQWLGTAPNITSYSAGRAIDPSDITEMLAMLELVINFASYGKERPQKPITLYMHEVLKYPNDKVIISKKTDETCYLKHLLSLWHNLSIHRARLSGGSHMFTDVDSCYFTGLDYIQITALKARVDTSSISDVLTILYDYILFNLCDQQDLSTPHPNEKLQDSLFNFSTKNLFLTHGNPMDYKLMPESILVTHAMSTWTNLVLHSKEFQV